MKKEGKNTSQIEEIYRVHYRELCLFAISFVRELETAEDVVQDLFVKLISQKKDLSGIKNLRAYLFNSTRNACLNYLNDHQRSQQKEALFLKRMSQTDSIEEVMMKAKREIEIYKAIDSLPEQCKRTFILCNVNELKYNEAAEELNVSVNSVKTQMKKAYRILRNTLKKI